MGMGGVHENRVCFSHWGQKNLLIASVKRQAKKAKVKEGDLMNA